ncbi:uncharacterized protein LOC100889583 isoform X2 [Strongylocentrotus purpuratus]|uniref:C2H2-type domain-containing protein n=1 Tax=Strongylocentrotus purpuratus TaxID=7668 RepID=A0A7M7HJP8_STRPU|nr:uncharacterized protein LOC100889583 isoform X2 [Strongylocentrotus purpuratus]
MEQPGPTNSSYKDPDETIRDLIGLIGAYSGEQGAQRGFLAAHANHLSHQELVERARRVPVPDQGDGHRHQAFNYLVAAAQRYGLPLQEGGLTAYSRGEVPSQPEERSLPVAPHHIHLPNQEMMERAHSVGVERRLSAGSHQPEPLHYHSNAPSHAQHAYQRPASAGPLVHRPPMHQEIMTNNAPHSADSIVREAYVRSMAGEEGDQPDYLHHSGGQSTTRQTDSTSVIQKAYEQVMGTQESPASPSPPAPSLQAQPNTATITVSQLEILSRQQQLQQQHHPPPLPPQSARHGNDHIKIPTSSENIEPQQPDVKSQQDKQEIELRPTTESTGSLEQRAPEPVAEQQVQQFPRREGDEKGEGHQNGDSIESTGKTVESGLVNFGVKQSTKCASCLAAFTPADGEVQPGVLPLCHTCLERFTSTLPRCKECGKKLTTDESLITHQCDGQGESFMCEVCGKVFSLAKHLSRHKVVHNPFKAHECAHCGKRFGRMEHLKRHRLTHAANKPYMCDKCGKTFSRSDNLNTHKCNLGEPRPRQKRKPLTFEDTGEVHPCDMCDKKFPTHQKLKRHKRQHSQSKPHQCNQCEKSFSCISHLKRHKMGHLGVKPFSCTLCGKSFGTTSHLNRHMMTHTGSSTLFKCKKCTAFFSTSEQLKEHYQIHMQQPHPPISTNSHFPLLLNKDPSNEDTRQSHFPVHYEEADDREHNTDMYCCHICKRYFNNPISLNQHNCFPADESHNHGSSMQESFTSPPASGSSNQYNSEMTSPPLSAPISAPISAPLSAPLPTQPEVTAPVSTLPQPLEALGLSAKVVQPLPSQSYKDLEQTTHHLLAVAEKASHPEAYTTKEKGNESEQDLPRSLNEIDPSKEIANEKIQLIHTVIKDQTFTDEEIQKRLFTCKVCGIFCGSLTGLQLHVQVHTLERPFKCETCGKRFRRQSHMERHRLIHSGVKPYSCDICEKTFTRPDNLNFHRSTHFKNEECEPIPCGTCGRKYPNVEMFGKHKCMDPATAAKLPVHLRPKVKRYYIGENEEKPCDVCGKVFRSGSRLTRHMLIHSRPNSFKCDVCSKVFNRRDHLKRHQLTHSGIRPYGCTQCGKRFVRNDHLQHHMRCHLISEAGNKGRGGGGGRGRGKGRGRPRGVGKGRGKLAPVKPDNAFFCHVCGMRFSNMPELEQHECTNNSPSQAVMTVPKPLQRINRRKRKTKLHVTKRKINEGPTVKEEDEQDIGINDEAGPSRRKSARPRKSTARRFSAVLTSDVSDDEGAKGTVAWDHDSPYPSRKIGNLEPREKQLRSCRENKLHTCDICGNVFHHFQIFQQHQMICAYKTSSMYYDEPEPEPDQGLDQGPEPEDLDSEVEEGEIIGPQPAPPVGNAVVLAGQVSNSTEEEVTCGVCGKSFNKMEKLMRHVKIHTTDKKYECEFCKKSFGRSDHLARHRRTHTEKKFHCKRCDDRFKDVKEYRLHMETHKEIPVEKAYSCTLCDMSFPKHTTLIKHKLSHNVEGQHQCKKCGDVHPDETSLESHECQQDEDKVHSCLDCGKGFKTVYALTRHLFCHTGLRPYECEKCGKKFTRSGHLRRHQISHSDEKPYDCDLCDKKFRRIDHMRIHKKTHEKKAREKREPSERPYGCDICNKKFRTEPALERHKTRHTVERRYMCDICGKTFKRMDNLRMHNRVHTGEKPHTCQECGKQFSHHTALRGHMRTHSDEQPYVCEICGRAFKHPHNMRSHQYVHGLQKPFNCEHCQKPFRDTYHLRLHISRCHDPDRVRKPRGGGRKSSSATGGATAAAASAAAAAAAAAANANNLIINPNQQAEQKPVINSPVSEAEPSATPHQSTESPSPVPSSHLKKNPLACERCHLAFPNLEHLHTHQCPALYHMSAHVSHTSHSSHSSFNCNRCNRTFQDSHQLRMHLLTHKEDPSVICAISAIQENFEEPQAIQQRYQMAVHPDHPGPLAYTVPHQTPYMISQSNQLAYSVAHSLPNPRVHGAHGEVPSYQML